MFLNKYRCCLETHCIDSFFVCISHPLMGVASTGTRAKRYWAFTVFLLLTTSVWLYTLFSTTLYNSNKVLPTASLKSAFTFVWAAKSFHLLTTAFTWLMMASAFLMFIFLATSSKSSRVIFCRLPFILKECWLTHVLPVGKNGKHQKPEPVSICRFCPCWMKNSLCDHHSSLPLH